jgi:glucans biosynthesis protein
MSIRPADASPRLILPARLRSALRWLLACTCGLWLASTEAAVDWAQVVDLARERAAAPYQPAPVALPDWLLQLDYSAWQGIRFDPNAALWSGQNVPFSVRFHHLGSIYRQPIAVREIAAGKDRTLAFSPGQFFYGSGVDRQRLPADLGYAGFTIYGRVGDRWRPVLEFLGGSFMRAGVPLVSGGVRARALAIDTGLPGGEEFPVFTDFWLVRPAADAHRLTLYALLESARVSGAYRINLSVDGEVVTRIDAKLFFRDGVGRLGLGPLSSMFWYGENGPAVDDYRPEVHSSDGLAIVAGGERLWRPLANLPRLAQQAVPVPPGSAYGLLQRDRDFEHYQDLETAFQAQPSVLLEPLKGFGAGRVELLELPVRDGLNQNVLAYFVPQGDVHRGDHRTISYRLRWGPEPAATGEGRVLATRSTRDNGVSTFEIDFAPLSAGAPAPRPDIAVSGGKPGEATVRALGDGWRLTLPVAHADDAQLTVRAALRGAGDARSETWLYHLGEE